jgi:protease II
MRSMLLGFVALCVVSVSAAQQVPPSIRIEGVPEIPPQVVRKLTPYQNMRSAFFSDWHPANRELLVATRFGDSNQVHHVKAPGGARTQLTFFLEPVNGGRFSRAGKNWFLFGMDEGGGEFFQLYRFDFDTGEHILLTDGKSLNRPGPSSNKGDLLAYTSTKRNGRDHDIYVMDPADASTAKLVYEVRGAWSPLDWSPDDSQLLIENFISANESYIHVLDLATGKPMPLLPATAEKVAYGEARFSRDGKGFYIVTDKDSEFQRLYYVDKMTKQMTPLTAHINWDVQEFSLSRDGSYIAFVTNEDGIGKLHLMSTGARKELPLPKLPVGQVMSARFHRTLPEIAFNMVTSKSPMDVYSYSYKTGESTRWTYSESGGLNTSAFPETELIHYPTFDQIEGKARMIPAFITKPPARFKPPYPVMIEIHGGPEAQARPGLNSSYFVNEMGIARVVPNVRGSAGYGKTYLQLDNAEKREDSVKDIGALLDWIAKQPDFDAKRVAVMGGSYGGYMTLASAVHYSGRLRCGIDSVGISNWVTFLNNTQSYRQDLRRAEYGDERDPKMRDLLETISPLNNTEKIKIPLLVIQGKNDPRVPVTESLQMVKKLRAQGNTVWYIEGLDEGHGFRKKTNRDYQQWAQIVFLQEFLLK